MSIVERGEIFTINSRDKVSGSDSNFTFRLQTQQSRDYDSILLLDASFPKTFYLFTDLDNVFTLTEVGGSAPVTIPKGNYTIQRFTKQLSALLVATSVVIGGNYTYVVRQVNKDLDGTFLPGLFADEKKLSITVSNNAGDQPILTFPNAQQPSQAIGFNKGSSNTFITDILNPPNVYDMNRESTLLIKTNLCDNGHDNTLGEVFSGDVPDGTKLTFQQAAPETNTRKLLAGGSSVYNFSITNENNEDINFNGGNPVFTILIYKKLNFGGFLRMVQNFLNKQK